MPFATALTARRSRLAYALLLLAPGSFVLLPAVWLFAVAARMLRARWLISART
jgi:hypothetical protein